MAKRVSRKVGGEMLSILPQYNEKEYKINSDGTEIKAVVDTTSGDGTGTTPHKRRNEISFRDGCSYNYSFQLEIKGSQKDAIVNLWQIKQLGDKFPRISLGVKRVKGEDKLALKVGSDASTVIGDAGKHVIKVDCENGKLFVDGKQVATFKSHSNDETIAKFGIEADKEFVDKPITIFYKNLKISSKKK